MDEHEQLDPTDPTRRAFLRTIGSSAAVAVIAGCARMRPEGTAGQAVGDPPGIAGTVPITLRINGTDHKLSIDPRTACEDRRPLRRRTRRCSLLSKSWRHSHQEEQNENKHAIETVGRFRHIGKHRDEWPNWVKPRGDACAEM